MPRNTRTARTTKAILSGTVLLAVGAVSAHIAFADPRASTPPVAHVARATPRQAPAAVPAGIDVPHNEVTPQLSLVEERPAPHTAAARRPAPGENPRPRTTQAAAAMTDPGAVPVSAPTPTRTQPPRDERHHHHRHHGHRHHGHHGHHGHHEGWGGED